MSIDNNFIDNRLTQRLSKHDERLNELETIAKEQKSYCEKLELSLRQQERQLGIGYVLIGAMIIILTTLL